MATIDEIEQLRTELRNCRLTANERRDAESNLAELLRIRSAQHGNSPSSCGTPASLAPGTDADGATVSTHI